MKSLALLFICFNVCNVTTVLLSSSATSLQNDVNDALEAEGFLLRELAHDLPVNDNVALPPLLDEHPVPDPVYAERSVEAHYPGGLEATLLELAADVSVLV